MIVSITAFSLLVCSVFSSVVMVYKAVGSNEIIFMFCCCDEV